MADSYGLFWNSINSDRTYDADSFAEWLRKFFTTGVFNGEMQVIPDSGMVIDVEPGYVNINGKVRFFENMQAFTIDPASGVYPRIDAIVVRSDSAARAITCEYVKGDYSGNTPTAPTPTRTGGIYEIVLANIYVGAGATQILSNDITDTRADSDLCGWVTSTVEGVPMEQIVAQMQAQFMTWFDEMKDQLSEDAAGHLQQEIDILTAAVNSTATIVQKHDTDFAPTESGTIAEQMHSAGQYFMLDHRLCKAIANIAEGDTLSVGVNFEYVTVGDELTALNAGLMSVGFSSPEIVTFPFTADRSGMLLVQAGAVSSSTGAYIYITDRTLNSQVVTAYNLDGVPINQYYPCVKGHTYAVTYQSNVNNIVHRFFAMGN